MKFIKIYLLFMVGLLAFTACDENLEVEPTKELESNYFTDEIRFQHGVLGVYAKLTDLYSYESNNPHHELWLLPGDDLRSRNPQDLDNFKGITSTNGDIGAVYGTLYEIINRANTMLEIIKKNEDVYSDAALMDANKGELLFLRGWAFYKLWSWFEKSPIITERIVGLDNVHQPPSNELEMLNQSIEDLKSAAELLPGSWPDAEKGRVTVDAAYGMLVKTYVTRANYQNNDAEDFNKAIAAFENISETVQLVDHFGKNFDMYFENNEESLFEFQASEKPGQENPWLDNDFGPTTGSMGAFYQHFMNQWTNNGALTGPTLKLLAIFDPEDPRFNETMDSTDVGDWTFSNGYKIIKYIKEGRNEWVGWGIQSVNNTRILRYADVKLLAAEAYLQTGQEAKALEQINDVRERARFSTEDGSESATPANLATVTMEDIMNERLVELVGEEGHRWNDLRRWHTAGYINLGNWNKLDFGFSADYSDDRWGFDVNKHLLMPIPLSEIDNNPLMASEQNPGY